jgi:uncharacterized protein YbjT (DUF2867 family)
MNTVVVFGGTGDVGRIIVKKLILMKSLVKVLTRTQRNSETENGLEYVIGDVLDSRIVKSAIDNGDTVIIALGFNNSSLDTMSKGTQNIVSAMLEKGCNRIVCLSAQGAGDSWDHMPDSFREMVRKDPVLSASFKDHTNQEHIIEESGLDWTIVRPTEIVDSPESGDYLVNGFGENLSYQISKYDVAQFIVGEVFQHKYSQRIAMITC